jgi:hypothetical protein
MHGHGDQPLSLLPQRPPRKTLGWRTPPGRPLEPGQYTSDDYATLAGDLEVTLSSGRTGQCWDNALAESFFASLKGECLDQQPGRPERPPAAPPWRTSPGTTAPGSPAPWATRPPTSSRPRPTRRSSRRQPDRAISPVCQSGATPPDRATLTRRSTTSRRWPSGKSSGKRPAGAGPGSVLAGGRDRDRTCDFCRVNASIAIS